MVSAPIDHVRERWALPRAARIGAVALGALRLEQLLAASRIGDKVGAWKAQAFTHLPGIGCLAARQDHGCKHEHDREEWGLLLNHWTIQSRRNAFGSLPNCLSRSYSRRTFAHEQARITQKTIRRHH